STTGVRYSLGLSISGTGSAPQSRSDALLRTMTADEKFLADRPAPRFHSALRSGTRMARGSPQAERRKRHRQSGPLLGGWTLATIPSPPRRPTMRYSTRRAFRVQLNSLRRQFLQDGDLPFTDVLTEGVIAQALATLTGWLDRIFSPLVTLWVFLGQVLSADHSCRAAVARLITHRLAQGQRP